MTSDQWAWAGERVERWLRQAASLEAQFVPVTELLFAAAAIEPGETVLDVGCGTGPTTRRAATLAGADGEVHGLDIAPGMLAAAAREPVPDDAAPIEWVQADAADWPDAPTGRYDLVLSRFGVMFFADPPAAVRTLAEAARPGGRLAAAVWARREQSPLFEVPLQAALAVVTARGPRPEVADPDDGPYSWHDPHRVSGLLEREGWREVDVAEHALRLSFAGGGDAAASARAALDFGPTQRLLDGADADTAAAAEAAIADAFEDYLEDGQVVLDASVRIVTACR